MSKQELKKTLQDFAIECDKLAKHSRSAATECTEQQAQVSMARVYILEAHRDWANNLLPKI